MTVFLIDAECEAKLRAAADRARTKPIPWDELKVGLPKNQDTDRLELSDRVAAVARDPEQIILPFGWRVAITCEEQPAGLLLHVSMSSPVKGRVPHPESIKMLTKALGFKDSDIGRAWLEEFEPGWHAFNVVFVLELREPKTGTMQ